MWRFSFPTTEYYAYGLKAGNFRKSLFFSNPHKRLISASALQSKETYIHMWVYCSLSIYLGLNAPGHLSNKPHYSTSEEREGESVSYNNNYELKANPIKKIMLEKKPILSNILNITLC